MTICDRDFNTITDEENLLWEELKEQEKVVVNGKPSEFIRKSLYTKYPIAFVPLPGMAELYKLVVLDVYKTYKGNTHDERRELTEQIAKLNAKLANARELLFDERLGAEDFAIIKKDCEEKIKRLEVALSEARVQKSNTASIDQMVLKAIEALSDLKKLYADGDALAKRAILGSIYREKLRFDGKGHRTQRMNEAALLIFQLNKQLGIKKMGKNVIYYAFPV